MSTKRVEELYAMIKSANDELVEIRKECPHDNWFEGNYMWAPGHIHPGAICDDCGEFLGDVRTLFDWVQELNDNYDRYNICLSGYSKPFERRKVDVDNTDGVKFTKKQFIHEMKNCNLKVPKNLESYLDNWIKYK